MSDDAVRVDITINAPPEKVWKTVLDSNRLDEWVTIVKKVDSADPGPPREGMKMKQTLVLRGAPFKVSWTLTECEENRFAKWEGRGPARSVARTEYTLTENADGGTDFHYVNEFKAPGGALGKVASKALVGGIPEREATASLRQLKELLEQ